MIVAPDGSNQIIPQNLRLSEETLAAGNMTRLQESRRLKWLG